MKDHLALALSVLFHDSPRRARQYYDLFGSFDELQEHWNLLISQIEGKFKPVVAQRWAAFNANQLIEKLARLGCRTVMLHHPDYPILLKEIDDAPPVLYVRGQVAALSQDMMAIVGTRAMSDYGQRVTGDIASALSGYFCIVSGLARGIDTVAHTVTLANGGTTVAIMGTAIDAIYPKENEALSQRIMETGAIVSESPPGTDIQAFRFPQRNRLISGIARGVVVVEARDKSGALSTASHAISQNRDLFAVPGSVYNDGSQGPNRLIKQGAICVTTAADILSEYHRLPIPRRASTPPIQPNLPTSVGPEVGQLPAGDQAVWDALSTPNQSIDQLSETTQIPLHQLLPILTMFELKGWVEIGAGRRYSRPS
ncbi:DNA-protecting protein DprA [bacterium]|nr:DNA-protecting protein DprA [bacterium]